MQADRLSNIGYGVEHDACGLVVILAKDGQSKHELVREGLDALDLLAHRSGEVHGEGDGVGVSVDVPRALWQRFYADAGQEKDLLAQPGLVFGHGFMPEGQTPEELLGTLPTKFDFHLELLRRGEVFEEALGPLARAEKAVFWQWTLRDEASAADRAWRLLQLLGALEHSGLHVASLDEHSVVYKLRGSPSALHHYFADLNHPACTTSVMLGHTRYSTNTQTAISRVQPFLVLGHNGEINTIRRLRREMQLLGLPISLDGSDSQDLDRLLLGLMARWRLSLIEAMEFAFPPILHEIKQLRPDLQDLYMTMREVLGPFAQGPAGIVARYGPELVVSVDALGLRPLWRMTSEERVVYCSEKGIAPSSEWVEDPHPLSPGEKEAWLLGAGQPRHLPQAVLRLEVLRRSTSRGFGQPNARQRLRGALGAPCVSEPLPYGHLASLDSLLAGFGWEEEDQRALQQMGQNGAEPIGSLGYDGALGCLMPETPPIADLFQEAVAVVTNPAIDREREIEHFSTRIFLGYRPSPADGRSPGEMAEVLAPWLFGGHPAAVEIGLESLTELAESHGTALYEELLGSSWSPVVLPLHFQISDGLEEGLKQLVARATQAILGGSMLLILDDAIALSEDRAPIDPHLALGVLDLQLGQTMVDGLSLRRRCGLVLRSGGLRNLHDLALALGLGADALNPYLLWETAVEGSDDPAAALGNVAMALTKGLEKVISTLGIHELRGYGRSFASIGLSYELATAMGVDAYLGDGAVDWQRLERSAVRRAQFLRGEAGKAKRPYRLYPKLWKAAREAATAEGAYSAYRTQLTRLEAETPINLRHLLEIKPPAEVGTVQPHDVDVSVGIHRYPLAISSMSFGSQGEIAYRAYAEAAYRLGIISLNGEGGEIPDLLGRYPDHRGHQVASGRFGINGHMLGSVNLIEIKIGQGAKPGEGGHLPGAKVSLKVAQARNAQAGVDLISPSNNHDIYSIEDLAQLVEELKTANPKARVIVKLPVVPGIGTIAVGVAKANADVVTLSGFDGGTGAARRHALRRAGFPVEIGVAEAHRALLEAGLRDEVELWADGGLRSGRDVLKMILLGANRAAFGTLAMVAIGCTICRACHLDTCHVGIATQLESEEEAERRGLRRFIPRRYEEAVEHLVAFFGAMGEELRAETAALGARRTQDLVGRSDLLHQHGGTELLDLSSLLRPAPHPLARGRRPVRPAARGDLARSLNRFNLPSDAALETYRHPVPVTAKERVLGSDLHQWDRPDRRLVLQFPDGSVPGNGLYAFGPSGLDIQVVGGAQDGMGKGARGGTVSILKGPGRRGRRVDGGVGKSFAYGAQGGRFLIQGDADTRAAIRLSGGDIVFGARPHEGRQEGLEGLATHANLKGFAFEYMTGGRAVVLGDPGPWMCAGMTGGVVYLRLEPALGLDQAGFKRRLAKGAKVFLRPLERHDLTALTELLEPYRDALLAAGDSDEAHFVSGLLQNPQEHFIKVLPLTGQEDSEMSTE